MTRLTMSTLFVIPPLLALLTQLCLAEQILEPPEDVTVLSGDPASLTCRVSGGPVFWYKDGLEIELSPGHNTDTVVLPDGSLFFLTTRSEDTGLYHCQTRDGQSSYPAALIVGTEEEGIIPSLTLETLERTESAALPHTETETEPVLRSVEVVEDQEVPSSVYIISMIVVALLTILIILGAALIFSKIKRVNTSLGGGESLDRESTAPMMYAVPREIIKQPPPHYNYILTNEYDTPINFVSSEASQVYNCVNNTYERGSPSSPCSKSSASSPSSSNHYASSKILLGGTHSHNPGSVKKYKGRGDGRYPNNYFAC